MISNLFVLRQSASVIRLLSLMLISVLSMTAGVAGDSSAKNTAPIAPYLDQDTAIIAWADISQIDLDGVADFLTTLDDNTAEVNRRQMQQPKQIQATLSDLGVKRVFWVGELAELTTMPKTLIVPTDSTNGPAVKQFFEAIIGRMGGTAVQKDGTVLVGTVDRLRKLQSGERGKPDAAFLATVNSVPHPHCFTIRTSDNILRPVAAMLPGFSKADEQDVANAAQALNRVRSITVSGSLPPTSGQLVVTTADNQSARQVSDLVNGWTQKQLGTAAAPLQMTAEGANVVHATTNAAEVSAAIDSLKQLLAPAREKAYHAKTMNSMKQIALAMHNFHDTYGTFPPQALANDRGKRLLSWRVMILPFLDQNALYQQFHLDEPWDSPHNKSLIAKMPAVYQTRSTVHKPLAAGMTRMVAPLTKHSLFGRPGDGVEVKDIVDGLSNTLMVIQAPAEAAVVWTKPEDLSVTANSLKNAIIGDQAKGFFACMCDGAALFLPKTIDEETLNSLLTIHGEDVIKPWR